MRASIVTAGGTGLGVLFDVLEDLGVSDIWVLGNPIGDRYLFEPSPDMVVGVLNPRPVEGSEDPSKGLSNLDVMLRIGRAAEREVPAIVIVPPPLMIPSPAEGVVLAPCPADHQSALSTHLWAFTTALGTLKDRSSKESNEETPHVDSARILNELAGVGNISGWQFEQMIRSILMQAGAASVASKGHDFDDGVDIAFAPSDDSSGVILVEAKYGNLDERRLRDAEQQLQRHVLDRRAVLGLVIYHESNGRQFPQRSTLPRIVRLSVEELVGQLATHSLTQVLSDATASAIDRI